MIKTIKIIKEDDENYINENYTNVDMVFKKVKRDLVGKSASNPTWGYVFNVKDGQLKLNIDRTGLYKEHDYDYPKAAYAEKIASIIGRGILENTRVPKIDVVLEKSDEPAIISYKVLNNDKEDMFHISDLLFYKYDRSEISKKKNIFTIEDILECVQNQVQSIENYKTIEKSIIHTFLFDSVINNGDRHSNNWALVRDKETGKYELAVYDHSSCFIDMLEEKRYFTCKGWVGSYITLDDNNKNRNGDIGKDIIQYISRNYEEYFNEFADIFEKKLPMLLDDIKSEQFPVDIDRLVVRLNERKKFLNKIKSKEELGYGEY